MNDPLLTSRALALAADPATAPSLLTTLATHPNSSVQRRVAAHPSTPLDTLFSLLATWPDAVLTNPSLELGLLADPLLLGRAPLALRSLWIKLAGLPPWLVEQLDRAGGHPAEHPAAGHPRCPPELLEQMSQHPSEFVRSSVAGNPGCPPALLDRLAADPSPRVRMWVAGHPGCSPAALTQLMRDRNPSTIATIAGNPSCRYRKIKGGWSSPALPRPKTRPAFAALCPRVRSLPRLAHAFAARSPTPRSVRPPCAARSLADAPPPPRASRPFVPHSALTELPSVDRHTDEDIDSMVGMRPSSMTAEQFADQMTSVKNYSWSSCKDFSNSADEQRGQARGRCEQEHTWKHRCLSLSEV